MVHNNKIITKLVSLLVLIIALVVLSRFYYSWDNLEPATCFSEDNCFCENVKDNIKQPINTISAFAIILVAIWIFFDSSPFNIKFRYLYSLVILVMGLGTALYHASLSYVGQVIDVLGLYSFSSLILIYALFRITNRKKILIAYPILVIIITYFAAIFPEYRKILFAIFILLALIFEIIYILKTKPKIKILLLSGSILAGIVAFVIWYLDYFRILCDPKNIIQGHAIWHILSAVAVYLLYFYYKSEK